MPFLMPDPYVSKITGALHSKQTLVVYKTHLNRLAKEGWGDPQALYDNDSEIAQWIRDSDLPAVTQRKLCVSIFYAINLEKEDVQNLEIYKLNSELKKAEIRQNKADDKEYLAKFLPDD
jgi:hypothetical protein